MPTSQLPKKLASSMEEELSRDADSSVIVYDLDNLHSGGRRSLKFGKARTSQVQLLGQDVEMNHFELTFDATKESLLLTNNSTKPLLIAASPEHKLSLEPGHTRLVSENTAVGFAAYGFRIVLPTAKDGKPSTRGQSTPSPERGDEPEATSDNAPGPVAQVDKSINKPSSRSAIEPVLHRTKDAKHQPTASPTPTADGGAAPHGVKRKAEDDLALGGSLMADAADDALKQTSKRIRRDSGAEAHLRIGLNPYLRTLIICVSAFGVVQRFIS